MPARRKDTSKVTSAVKKNNENIKTSKHICCDMQTSKQQSIEDAEGQASNDINIANLSILNVWLANAMGPFAKCLIGLFSCESDNLKLW